MHADMWATSLPCELLLDILRRLGSTSVVCCAGVCRPWRRAIIDYARSLWPRPDRFLPDLLLAIFDAGGRLRQHTTPGRIEDVAAAGAGPSAENVLALESVVDISLYHTPLTSRDGFLLLWAWGNTVSKSNKFCLCNLLTGSCMLLPAAGLGASSMQCAYVLVTGYDNDDDSQTQPDGASGSTVRIVAVAGEENWMTYRIFSSVSGAWGPVKRSAKLSEDPGKMHVLTEPKHAVVCSGTVLYCLALLYAVDGSPSKYSMFAMDMRTERTWTTEVPKQCDHSALVLATSEDGRRPSVIASPWQGVRRQINVWVLDSESRWTLQWTMDMQRWLLPICPNLTNIWLSGFCPRSGCFFGIATGVRGPQEQFLVSVDGSSSRLMARVASRLQKLLYARVRDGLVNLHIKDEVFLASTNRKLKA